MAANILKKGEIVLQYLDKYQGLSKHAVAAKLHHDYPLIFHSPQDARWLIRYYTGATGDNHRKNIDKEKLRKWENLPKSKSNKRKDYVLPPQWNSILWLSDIHIPNHNREALALALQYGIDNKINCIILGGDLIDNNPFTRHDKKPDRGEAKSYFEDTTQFLITLRFTFPDAKIIWLEGNHDKWYEKWLQKNAPVIFDDPYYQLEQRLQLKDFEIEYLKEEQVLKIDGLHCLHGHTLIRGVFSPVNPARGVFLRAKASTIIGHCR